LYILVQKLELQKQSSEDAETVKGQIVVSLISRDRGGGIGPQVADISNCIPCEPDELPEGSVQMNLFNTFH
jgi:hypothetical protein